MEGGGGGWREGGDERGREGERGRSWGWWWRGWREEGGGAESLAIAKEGIFWQSVDAFTLAPRLSPRHQRGGGWKTQRRSMITKCLARLSSLYDPGQPLGAETERTPSPSPRAPKNQLQSGSGTVSDGGTSPLFSVRFSAFAVVQFLYLCH